MSIKYLLSRDVDIYESVIRRWVKKYEENGKDAFPGKGKLLPADEEMRTLRRRLADLKEENAILKKAVAISHKTYEIKYQFIYEHRFKFHVEKMCRILNVSRSGYYDWMHRPESNRKKTNENLVRQIKRVHRESRETYGILRVKAQLNKEGIPCGKNRVAQLMRENHIYCRTRRKYKATTNSKHNYPVASNILDQDFGADRPNQV